MQLKLDMEWIQEEEMAGLIEGVQAEMVRFMTAAIVATQEERKEEGDGERDTSENQ